MIKQYDNYLPIEPGLMTQILTLLDIKPGETFCDLGSGDGRVVIAAAQLGAIATGIELNADLALESRQQISASNVTATIIEGDMYDAEIAPYDVVYAYLSHDMMRIMFDKYQQSAVSGNRMFMWCGYGTDEVITARACYDCSYFMDEQHIFGGVLHRITSDVDGKVHYGLIVTTPHE